MPAAVLFRWLLAIATTLTILVGAVTSYAASGMIGDSTCCCPDPDSCKCHDDGEHPAPDAKMKRCQGEGELVAPHIVPCATTDVVEAGADTTSLPVVTALSPAWPAPRHVEIETPPF